MGDPKGFLNVKRETTPYRPVCERVKDYNDVLTPRSEKQAADQASRCMDCGTPFCHWGCPIGNLIPEWNDALYKKDWEKAYTLLGATNDFPEFTGRLCPAPCEHACVLGINDDPVTIRENELSIIEYAFKNGLVKPQVPKHRTNKTVAVVGSGPAGLAAAAQLNQAGHSVTVFERDTLAGGILRYGIPDFKLEKHLIDRRVKLLEQEGITFTYNTDIGKSYSVKKLKSTFDALCLTGGSRQPRDLRIEGRDLTGIHFAMDYLTCSNLRMSGKTLSHDAIIDAAGKRVVVIGGGDTGADCVGTAHRQGASCVVQIEVLPQPPEGRTDQYPWPLVPLMIKTSSSHQEGGDRYWSILTKKFVGEKGAVKKLACVRVEFEKDTSGTMKMNEVPGSEFEIEADLVILAIGFIHPEKYLLEKLALTLDRRGNVKTDSASMTSMKGVFAAGDMHRGQSLIVWTFFEGRAAARSIDAYLSK